MIVSYKPENGSPQTWTYAPAKVKQSEAEMIEKRFGNDWDAFNKAVLGGNSKARKALLWHCLRKDHPVFRWEDVPDFAMAEVTVEFEAQELADIRTALAKSKDLDDDVKASALATIDEQIASSPDPLDPAPSVTSASATAY